MQMNQDLPTKNLVAKKKIWLKYFLDDIMRSVFF